MERCLACEAVVSRGLHGAHLSRSALYLWLEAPAAYPDEWSFTSAVLPAIALASEVALQEWRLRRAWLESCLLANRFPSRAGTPAAALIKLFAGLGSNKAGGEK